MKIHLKAFTIMEIMVALAITAIIVTLSFYGLHLLQLQYDQYSVQQKKTSDARRCLLLLQWDAEQAKYISSTSHELYLFSPKDTITYYFSGDKVFREYGLQHRDSFTVEININNTKNVLNSVSNLLNEVELSIHQTDFVKKLTLSKNYSAADLMQWENEY